MTKYWPSVKVSANNQEQVVFYPPSDDPSEANDLRQHAIESTREELAQRQPKKPLTPEQKEKVREIMKESQARHERLRNGTGNKKYF